MAAGYIVGSLVGSFGIAYLCDTFVSDKKAFGGSILPRLFLTRSGGKPRTPSSRPGLAPLDRRSS
ncbi:uncharacterized protein C2845_PM01G29250 [Panicum miliaceum]|uniref:Uncharacterized protein n=1 Tax=Panicum miliaceum TaxID=4540 RepID=A0A3L6TLF0_PANMI|nr:uncharacterized protein C2845_PM01G29250 [Panicum miliaceum]